MEARVYIWPAADDPEGAHESLRHSAESWVGRPVSVERTEALRYVHDDVGYFAEVGRPERRGGQANTTAGKGAAVAAIFKTTDGQLFILAAAMPASLSRFRLVGRDEVHSVRLHEPASDDKQPRDER